MIYERTWRDAFLREPARIAIGQPHQVFLSGMSVTFTAAFFYDALGKLPFLHPAMAGAIAVSGAIGAEYAYLKGLADGAGSRSRWQSALIWTVFLLLVIAGTLVLLRYAYPLPALASPGPELAALLTLAHIVPLAFLGLCSARLHAEAEARYAAARAAADAETRERERQRSRAEAERQRSRAEAEAAAEARRIAAEAEAAEYRIKAQARLDVRAQSVRLAPANNTPHSASGTAANSDRTVLRAQVARTLREQPDVNRSQLARDLGVGRTTLYELIKEAQAEGLL